MAYSCIATMAIYNEEKCLDRLEAWYHWHQNWAYAKIPEIPLPADIPLDPDTVPVDSQIQNYGRVATDISENADRNALDGGNLFLADEFGVRDARSSSAHESTAALQSDAEFFTIDIREDDSATSHLSGDEEFDVWGT